jgi:hypothetical protein
MPRPNVYDFIRPVTVGRPPRRPAAPKGLSELAKMHWGNIVASRPPEYFDAANQVLLGCLCEHMAHSDWVAEAINGLDPDDPKDFRRYARLTIMANRESGAIAALMTKLRLLPTKKAAEMRADTPTATAPWERHR